MVVNEQEIVAYIEKNNEEIKKIISDYDMIDIITEDKIIKIITEMLEIKGTNIEFKKVKRMIFHKVGSEICKEIEKGIWISLLKYGNKTRIFYHLQIVSMPFI